MMQQHMLSNMRDHLTAINEILVYPGNDELEKAADLEEILHEPIGQQVLRLEFSTNKSSKGNAVAGALLDALGGGMQGN